MFSSQKSQAVANFAVLLAVFAAATSIGCERPVVSAAPSPAPTVQVVTVVQKDVPVQGQWVGTLQGYVNAQIQPQVNGYLIRQNYDEGSFVRKGQALFEIDPRPFQAALDQAKGQLAQAQAQMANTQINVDPTFRRLKRTPYHKANSTTTHRRCAVLRPPWKPIRRPSKRRR